MVCLSRSYPYKFFKGGLPQILLGPFLNTLSHLKCSFLRKQLAAKNHVMIIWIKTQVQKWNLEQIWWQLLKLTYFHHFIFQKASKF